MHRICLYFLLSSLVWTIANNLVTAAETHPLTIEEINQTWNQRRERLQAMELKLSADVTSNKLSFMKSTFDDEDVLLTEAETLRYMKEKITYRMQYALLLDLPRFRCRLWGRRPLPQLKQMYNHDHTRVTDGKTAVSSFMFEGTSHITIRKDPKSLTISRITNLAPLRWSLLAGDPIAGTTLTGFTPRSQTEQIQGIDCTVLEKSDSRGLKRLWVAPRDHECVVMKYVQQRSGKTVVAYQFQYDHNANFGRIPQSWDIKCFYQNHPHFRYGCKITVDSFNSKATIPSEEFEFALPLGARVTDLRLRDPKGGEFSFVVQPDQ
jgi:hypothetical protein